MLECDNLPRLRHANAAKELFTGDCVVVATGGSVMFSHRPLLATVHGVRCFATAAAASSSTAALA